MRSFILCGKSPEDYEQNHSWGLKCKAAMRIDSESSQFHRTKYSGRLLQRQTAESVYYTARLTFVPHHAKSPETCAEQEDECRTGFEKCQNMDSISLLKDTTPQCSAKWLVGPKERGKIHQSSSNPR